MIDKEIDFNDFSLLKLSEAKDGDILLFASDDISDYEMKCLREQLRRKINTNPIILVIQKGDTLDLLTREEARSILERIVKES